MTECMDRIKYLGIPTVRNFSKWLEAKLDPQGVFHTNIIWLKPGIFGDVPACMKPMKNIGGHTGTIAACWKKRSAVAVLINPLPK